MQDRQQNVLDPATHVGMVTVAVSSLERSLHYYQHGLGFAIKEQKEGLVLLGAATGSPILALFEQPDAQPQPAHSTGLYHFAILLPTRKDLGRFLTHLAESRTPLGGYADHLVSEALYLSDPDGNGIEVYRDRPRSTWTWDKGNVNMASDPIDLKGLMAEGRQDTSAWSGLAAHTVLGHMHLRVANIPEGIQFYHGVLGFDIVLQMPSALFVSAGGYHHHIGMNTWESLNAPQPQHNAVGLRFFTIQLPDATALAQVVARLQAVNWPVEQHEVGVIIYDPWRNKLLLTANEIGSVETVQKIIQIS